MKLAYFIRDNGACGYYRLSLPIQMLAQKTFTEIHKFQKGDRWEAILKCLDAEIMVIPRVGEEKFLELIPELKNNGKKVIIDHDDNMFCISPLSPHYEEAGTEEVKYKLPNGDLIDVWTDGKNIDIQKNRSRQENFKKAMEAADMVTCTTEHLADVYRQYNKNVKVLPNCVDMNIWQTLPLPKNGKIRLCWFGGSSHYEDWLLLQDVLPVVMDKHKNVTLVLMGMKFDATLKRIDSDRIEFHEWVHTEAYPYKAAILNCDITIIPLRDTEFNRCKSPIKWIEMASLKIPAVTSYVSPYKEIAENDNGIFIENNDKEAWIEGISLLIEDSTLRQDIGRKAYQTVKDKFDINTQWHLWDDAYKELLSGG